jgi:hypothetical protein
MNKSWQELRSSVSRLRGYLRLEVEYFGGHRELGSYPGSTIYQPGNHGNLNFAGLKFPISET